MIKILLLIIGAIALLLSIDDFSQRRKVKGLQTEFKEEKLLRDLEGQLNNVAYSSRLALKDREIQRLRHALKASDEKRSELCARLIKIETGK